jgi:hypothetical protein
MEKARSHLRIGELTERLDESYRERKELQEGLLRYPAAVAKLRDVGRIFLLSPATGSPWVLSVENKESFYAACDAARAAWSAPLSTRAAPPSALLYTAGHPGSVTARAAALLGESAAAALHFGDMDPDGLLILQELERSSRVPVRPFAMDVDTFSRYEAFGRPLSRHARARLRQVTHAGLRSIAKVIHERGIGVEQEVIPVSF